MSPNDQNPETNPPVTPPANDVPPVETPVAEGPVETPAQEAPVASAEAVTPVEAPAPEATPTTPDAAAPTQAPAAEQPAVFSAAAGAPQGKKPLDKKKLILIGGIAGGVVLLAIIGFVLYSLFGAVSKEDYRDAARQFNDVSLASSSLTSDASSLGYASGSSSEVTYKEAVSDTEKSIETLKVENDELGELRAVRVGEGGKLYKTFNDKLAAYVAYAEDLVTSVQSLRPALVTCDAVSDADDADARVTALKACSTALSSAENIPNEQMKKYVDAIAKGYAEYATIYEKIAALSNPYGAQYEEYKTLRDQMYDTQDAISEASKQFTADLKARDDELSVKEAAEALADYLNDQQR